MRSYDLKGSLDFFLYVFDEENKEALTEMWLAKDFDMSLPDFIEKYSTKNHIKRLEYQTQSVEEDRKALALAASILELGKGEEVRLGGTV